KAPFYLAGGYEVHLDYFGLSALVPAGQAVAVTAAGPTATASSRDTGIKLVARYGVRKTRLGLIYERLVYEQDNSAAAPSAFKEDRRRGLPVTPIAAIRPG